MSQRHGLGFGNGKIVEFEDGTAGYVPMGAFSQTFRVKISDVSGFSVTKGGKMLERTINVLGNGTVLASASVPHGTPEKIEEWFRAHPQFGQSASAAHPPAAPAARQAPPGALSSSLVADELRKLADLRNEGVLTEDEFTAQKTRLLGG